MSRRIILISDPMAEPVFEIGPLDHRSLGISETLAIAIDNWDVRFKSFFDRNDFSHTNLYSEEARRAHFNEGARLARALQEELGDGFIVDYRG